MTTSYSDTGLDPVTTYYYRVIAFNGDGDSAPSNVAIGTTADVAPAAPTTLTATTFSDTAIDLAWADNSDNESGFRVEQSPDGSTGWAAVATTPANTTSYRVTGLSPSTQYFYRVVAFNAVGDSAVSNTANATTNASAATGGVKVEPFDVNHAALTTTHTLTDDVGSLNSAFVQVLSGGTRPGSAGPIGDTGGAEANKNTAAAQLTATDTLTLYAPNTINRKTMGQVWRYDGAPGGPNEFIVRGRYAITFSGGSLSESQAVSGIVNEDDCVPFLTGATHDRSNSWGDPMSNFGVRMDGSGNVLLTRTSGNADVVTAYVTVVEFTGSNWTVSRGTSTGHETTGTQTVTLDTDIVDWDTAFIVATMEGDTDNGSNAGGGALRGVCKPGSITTEVEYEFYFGTTTPANDGTAYIHVIRNPDISVYRDDNLDWAETQQDYAPVAWPTGAPTGNDLSELALEWFCDTDSLVDARGAQGPIISDATGTLEAWTHRGQSGSTTNRVTYGVIDLSAIAGAAPTVPDAPSGVQSTTYSDTRIDIEWADNSGDETGFRLETSPNGSTGWTTVTTTAPGVTSFSHTGLTPATQYYYRVIAVNAVGDSAASNVDNSTTKTGSEDAVSFTPGTLSAPFPTIEHIGLLWDMPVDAPMGTIRATTRYRETPAGAWKTGIELFAVEGTTLEGKTWTNRLAGTIGMNPDPATSAFKLDPDTEYEVEVTLIEPGVGTAVRTVTATTRAIPTIGTGAVINVSNDSELLTATSTAAPGDIINLQPGSYTGLAINQPSQSAGTLGNPITIRGNPGAVLTGELGIFGKDHYRVQDLTVNGRIRGNGSNHLSVVNCTVNTSAGGGINNDGIVIFTRAENAYIYGNTVIGDLAWQESNLALGTGNCINVVGPGHVIQNNTVSNSRDGISFLEDAQAVDQFCIDILDNTLFELVDDGIEADFADHNIRILRNRITNCFQGVSSQPALGGPTYVLYNEMYNIVHLTLKSYRGDNGCWFCHNTVVKHGDCLHETTPTPIDNFRAYNNLMLGGQEGFFRGFRSGYGRVITYDSLNTSNSIMNYNGYGVDTIAFTGIHGGISWSGIAGLNSLTTETDSIEVTYSVFDNTVNWPSAPLTQYAHPDLTIDPAGPAVDAGVALPGINDDFTGSAPNLGAVP